MIEFISAVPLPRRSRFGRRDAKFHQSRRGIYAAVKAAGCRIGGVSVGVDDPWLGVSLSAKAMSMRRTLPTNCGQSSSHSVNQAAKAICRIRSGVVGSAETSFGPILCVFIAIYSFFCRLAVSSNCDGVVYNL